MNKFNYPINVLILTGSFWGGGAERVIENLVRNIDSKKFNISICHLKDRGLIGEDLAKEGYDVFGLPSSKVNKNDYSSFLKLSKILKEKKISIIHSHTIDSFVDSSLCKLIFPKIKTIHTFHFGNYPHIVKKNLMIEKICTKFSNLLIAVSIKQQNSLRELYNIADHKITTIWNGIEDESRSQKSNICDKFKIKNKVKIGVIGTFIEQKGHSNLLQVAKLLKNKRKDFVFILVGEGPLRRELQEEVLKLHLEDHVIFTGWIKDASKNILHEFDIFFQPSLWEAMSIVILEALAAGKPILATKVGDNEYIIEHEKSGFISEIQNINKMVTFLNKLIDDKNLRMKIGNNAKDRFQKIGKVNLMVEKYESIYQKLITNDTSRL